MAFALVRKNSLPAIVLLILLHAHASAANRSEVLQADRTAHREEQKLSEELARLADADFSCEDCAALMVPHLSAYFQYKQKRLQSLFDMPLTPGEGYPQASAARLASATDAAGHWRTLREAVVAHLESGVYCERCGPDKPDGRVPELRGQFGSQKAGETIVAALREAALWLRNAGDALQRRDYDSGFAERFDKVFERWLGKPSAKNLARAGHRFDAMLLSLLQKAGNPNAYLSDSRKFPVAEFEDFDPATVFAFVAYDFDDLIFLTPKFFGGGHHPAETLIHEEAHLLFDTRDHGYRLQRHFAKDRGKRKLGTSKAFDDSYTFHNLVRALGNLR